MKNIRFNIYSILLIFLLSLSNSKGEPVVPPNGGVAVIPKTPIYLSGIRLEGLSFTYTYPIAATTEHLEVVNAGYYLANNGELISQLVYLIELDIKNSYPDLVYTKAILSNPTDSSSPFTYEGTISTEFKSTKVHHSPLTDVKVNEMYHLIFEVYEDEDRTELIEKIDQSIISPVDNTSGCVVIDDKYKAHLFGKITDTDGEKVALNKIIVACDK